MTENEIMEMLEICSSEKRGCKECPVDHLGYCECMTPMSINCLDLINRQKAEIERLTLEYAGFKAGVKHFADIGKMYSEVRAEAIKEFAERLKERKYQSSDWSHGEHPYVVEESDIDEILEEMTEGQP